MAIAENMNQGVVSLGEVVMRLKPPHKVRLKQARSLEICHGGAEANVVSNLAQFGVNTRLITALPSGDLGDLALSAFLSSSVDMRFVRRFSERMGLYFLEEGADLRSGRVLYDRKNTAFSQLTRDEVEWDEAFEGMGWFHVSGITPALSSKAAELCEYALKQARQRGLSISIDLNHRAKLWDYGAKPVEVMPNLVQYADVLIAGRGDCPACLGIDPDGDSAALQWYEALSDNVLKQFPNLEKVAITMRNSQSAGHHEWQAHLRTRSNSYFSERYEISNVVDRVGSGDAFCAGLIYGGVSGWADRQTLDFASGSNALKHTILGDMNCVSTEEVWEVLNGDRLGRLDR